jgi:hypothetical protein
LLQDSAFLSPLLPGLHLLGEEINISKDYDVFLGFIQLLGSLAEEGLSGHQ